MAVAPASITTAQRIELAKIAGDIVAAAAGNNPAWKIDHLEEAAGAVYRALFAAILSDEVAKKDAGCG